MKLKKKFDLLQNPHAFTSHFTTMFPVSSRIVFAEKRIWKESYNVKKFLRKLLHSL